MFTFSFSALVMFASESKSMPYRITKQYLPFYSYGYLLVQLIITHPYPDILLVSSYYWEVLVCYSLKVKSEFIQLAKTMFVDSLHSANSLRDNTPEQHDTGGELSAKFKKKKKKKNSSA